MTVITIGSDEGSIFPFYFFMSGTDSTAFSTAASTFFWRVFFSAETSGFLALPTKPASPLADAAFWALKKSSSTFSRPATLPRFSFSEVAIT